VCKAGHTSARACQRTKFADDVNCIMWNTLKAVTSMKKKWLGHEIWVRKLQEKTSLGRTSHRWDL
jgi:hypothetical protein